MAPKKSTQKATPATPNGQKKPIKVEESAETMDYDEVQESEIELLKSMYPEDYQQVEVKGAWNKTADRSFKLTIRPSNEKDSFVILTVRLTATYPKTLPVLQVDGLEKFHERTQQRIKTYLANGPKQLLGAQMIFSVADGIETALV